MQFTCFFPFLFPFFLSFPPPCLGHGFAMTLTLGHPCAPPLALDRRRVLVRVTEEEGEEEDEHPSHWRSRPLS